MSDSSPMFLQYERAKRAHADAFLFFRLGDFYELFREDATEASQILGLTLTHRQSETMCGVPFHAAKGYIQKLLAAGKKVAICEQVSVPGAQKGLVDREVVQVYTPGMLIDEEFLDASSNNFVISISSPRSGTYCVARCDFSTGELFLGALDETSLSQTLETLYSAWSPREFLVQESLLQENRRIQEFFRNKAEIIANRFGDWMYNAVDASRRLSSSLGLASLRHYGLEEGDERLHPVSALLEYGESTAFHQQNHLRTIRLESTASHVILDESCIRNLELCRNMSDGTRENSLLSVLDKSRTAGGARLIKKNILEPLNSMSQIQERLSRVDFLRSSPAILGRLRDLLRECNDVERIVNRVLLDRAHPRDLHALIRSLLTGKEILRILEESAQDGLFAIGFDEALAESIEAYRDSLSDDAPTDMREGGIFNAGYNTELDEQRNLLRNGEAILESYVEEERTAHSLGTLKLKSNRIIGHYLELNRTHAEKVPDHFKRRQSMSNAERFTTVRLEAIEREIQNARERSNELECGLFVALRDEFKAHAGAILSHAHTLAMIDLVCSFAYVAIHNAYVRPQISLEGGLRIRDGRHPVVEKNLPGGTFIPNDCMIGGANAACMLITGPNMAGKSTFLRQVALLSVMAHAGSFVPAADAEIPLMDRIFCRLGASDNLARGESTFLVEMHETASILHHATPASLVIMDEVGRGTSTQDGLALARAILEYLVERSRSLCLFATHYHELTGFEHENLRNFSLEVREYEGKVLFLKKVVEGPSEKSYGIHVAELAGLPPAVIARAQKLLEGSEPTDTQKAQAARPGPELLLFDERELVLDEVKKFRYNEKSPIEALNAVAGWAKRLGS